MVLPDIMEAVDGVGAHCRGRVSSADGFRISDGCEVVPDSEDVICRDADLTVWVESMSTYALTVGRQIVLTLHDFVPSLVDFGCRGAFKRRLVPQGVFESLFVVVRVYRIQDRRCQA